MDSSQSRWLVDLDVITQLKDGHYRYNDIQDSAACHSLFLDNAVYDSDNRHEGLDGIIKALCSCLGGWDSAQEAGLPEIAIPTPDMSKGVWGFRDDIERSTKTGSVRFFGDGHQHGKFVRTAGGHTSMAIATTTGIKVDPLARGLPIPFERVAA